MSAQCDDLQASTDAAIAACDGDPRAAVRALLVAVNYLEAEVKRLVQAVPVLTSAPEREQS
jgi:hypothetical protein